MAQTPHSFCRGIGSVAQLQPRTRERHFFMTNSRGDHAVAEHFKSCWKFVTDNMRESALKKLASRDFVQGLTIYLTKGPRQTCQMTHQAMSDPREQCWHLRDRTEQLDLLRPGRWKQEEPVDGHWNRQK